MVKVIFYFLISLLILTNNILLPVKSSENTEEELLLKGKASKTNGLQERAKLKIAVIKEIDALVNQVGDEFKATILNDVNVDDVNLIPIGSILVGTIQDIMHAGKASMQGTIDISLDKIILPSGKYIPLEGARLASGSNHTNIKHKLKGEGSGLAKGIGIGALKGATLTFIPGNKAVKTTAVGLAATGAVFSGGWSIGSTATIGGLTGLYYGIKKHGKEVQISSGQELEIELSEEQDLSPVEVAVDAVMDQGVKTADSTETVIK